MLGVWQNAIWKECIILENPSLAHRYREVAVKTANPIQLVVMLYDAAICSLKEAREHIDRRNIAGRSRSINKCNSIISELQLCLNLQAGGEIAGSLDQLYDYMKRRIFCANVEQRIQPLIEIEALLENLRSAWIALASHNQRNMDQLAAPQRIIPGTAQAVPPESMQLKSLNISI
jgi:flagellar secretion chaperone FliS